MTRSTDPQVIMAAMAHALQESRAAHHPMPALALTEADRAAAIQAIIYAEPRGPDPHGFLAIGELQERARRRTGLVLLHPATNSVRLTWVNDRPGAADAAAHGSPAAPESAAEMGSHGRRRESAGTATIERNGVD